ncbi:hypothetical protein BBOR36S_01844 [Brevibacillus borstelensis]
MNIARGLGNDASDNISQFFRNTRHGPAFLHISGHFPQALNDVGIGRYERSGALGIFLQGFCHCIFDDPYFRAIQVGVDVDADNSPFAQYNSGGILYVWYTGGQLDQPVCSSL